MQQVSHTRTIAYAIAIVIACAFSMPMCTEQAAAQDSLSDLQSQIESSAQDYNDATAKAADLQVEIDRNSADIEAISGQLPAKEAKCNDALRSMYKYQQQSLSLLSLVLDTRNVTDFLTTIDYLNRIQEGNLQAVADLQATRDRLQQTQDQLASAKADADDEAARAASALAEAQTARQQAQSAAVAKAAASTVSSPATSSPTTGSIDWSGDKSAFVAMWAPRIDSYLSGSPMAGEGQAFADAAWDYGVDPRWSPAIATVESSMGRYCFRPYNAWGWGSYGFGSWDDAVRAHVEYLGEMYGGYLTQEAANTYAADPTWYAKVSSQMAKI